MEHRAENVAASDRAAGSQPLDPGGLGHAELRDVLETVDEAILILDVQGSVVSMNGAALRLHGCASLDACRMTLDEYLDRFRARAPDGRELAAADRPIVRAVAGEAVHGLELQVTGPDGRSWIGKYGAVPFVSAEGRRLITVTIRDVTEQRRAVEALREADRRKDEFLSMLSHELRNPLAVIRTAMFLLDRPDAASDGARRAREVVSRQVMHLARLVDEILDVTRLARGRIELHRARLDLAELVQRVAEDHRPLLAASGLELRIEPTDGRVPIDGDATRLAQVLGNLLQNASKFAPRGGRVTVSVGRAGGWGEIAVHDTGQGIDPELAVRLFEPFVQGKRTLARTRGGLGLGLAIARGLVDVHGGTVGVRSEGGGCTFTVRLPLAGGAVARDGAAEGPAAGSSSARRVLVVDDNVDAAAALSDLVTLFGHHVSVVHDGPSAVALVRRERPDVVLCDIGLPGMDGYEVARTIRSEDALRRVRLVALSGYAQAEDRARAARAGFDTHLAKPADPDAIRRLLG